MIYSTKIFIKFHVQYPISMNNTKIQYTALEFNKQQELMHGNKGSTLALEFTVRCLRIDIQYKIVSEVLKDLHYV